MKFITSSHYIAFIILTLYIYFIKTETGQLLVYIVYFSCLVFRYRLLTPCDRNQWTPFLNSPYITSQEKET